MAQLKTDGVVGDDVALQVATPKGWGEAIGAANYLPLECRRLAGLARLSG